MDNRFQRIFLTVVTVLAGVTLSLSVIAKAAVEQPFSMSHFNDSALTEGSSDVDLDRRTVLEDILDNENFEIGVQFGVLSIEDFETNAWVSAHFAYHITEFFYAKARYGQSKAGLTTFEKLSNTPPLLTESERELRYYGLNIGYNLLPGEAFLGRDFVLNNIFSVELGAGNTDFAGDEKFTVNVTANYRVFLTDWVTWDIGMSDYIFDTIITGESKTSHNLNFNTGFAVYF